MSKKILSIVLALVLVMSTFAVSAFAVGNTGYEDDSTKTQTWALENERDNGDGTWSVDVRLTANYVVGAISFQVTNPTAEDGKLVGAELKSVTKGAALTFDADIQKNKTSGIVVIVPAPSDYDEKGVDLTNGGVVATLTFKLTAESADIAIKNDPKTKTNQGGDLIAVRLSDENLTTATWIYGQTVTSVGTTKTLGATQAADPVLNGVDGGWVDTDNMYVYGVPVGDDASAYFEVENGSFDVTGNATGSTLTVYTEGGDVFEEYTLIIFGDVTCDGKVNMEDSGAVDDHVFGISLIEDDVVKFAADVTADSKINMEDSGAIDDHVYGISTIAGNVWAA